MSLESNFKKIDGLSLEATTSFTFFKAIGSLSVIEELKEKLTVHNRSVGYRIMKLAEQKIFWEPRSFFSEEAALKLSKILSEINKLEPLKVVTYYYEVEGSIYIPAGFWWLGDIIGDCHLNKDVPLVQLNGLRDYQIEGLQEQFKYKRATVVMATGLGKTIMIASTCISMAEAGKRTMVVVPSDYLVGQIEATIKRYSNSVSGVSSKRKIKLGQDILVTTAGTATKHVDVYDAVIIDESHHSPASTWRNLLEDCDNVEYVYNYTATPKREDGMTLGIHAFGGPTVYKRDAAWGIENGWLCDFDVYCRLIKSYDSKGYEIQVSEKALRTTGNKKCVGNAYFLSVVAKDIISSIEKGRKVLVLGTSLEPLRMLKKILKGRVDFSVADANYKKPLTDFYKNETSILVATSKLVSEGIDLPVLDVLFLLTNHSSETMTYQSLGRILRKAEGKPKPLVIDCVAESYKPFIGSFEKRLKIWETLSDNIKTIKNER